MLCYEVIQPKGLNFVFCAQVL